ncbi:hypothetical protein HRbin07_00720 [bacterium HR07]|uniref:DUF2283 domain-containing protein n=2 Tax=Candidatus Bipolaricaulota TaxID=67810 RepID=H5SHZ4_9BACT|nr:hypothetical protein HGMM_F31E01C16 [uncultured Acetothermia bacterium]BAL55886.1 hypothetical protein HGMM_F32F05C44 [uncultured Acetothermia bacterium]BAL57093.1 hypothetical protein HGMM_F47C08C14 [uncultured Acetothermia bacterium]BAL58802.1 hypothetical protein HGMM_OP2C350 [Candidatus Acetothermum autotrophicum]GBC76518.1 hypothetical protein HRbin07_00720 [bacterium HR07]
MAQELILEYDSEGDILEASSSTHGATIAKDVGDDVWLKVEEDTGAVVGFLILNFIKRQRSVKLPLALAASDLASLTKTS